MILIIAAIVLGLTAILAVGAFVIGIVETFSGGDLVDAALTVAALAITVGATVGAVAFGIAGSRHYVRQDCSNFAEQTGYETKVIVTTTFSSGDCLVDFDGRWVPKDQLWAEVGPGGPR